MFKTLARLVRHRWYDASDARRAVPPQVAERLRHRVAASEQHHTGQIRLCIEGGLPTSYLWRHLRDRVAMPQIVRERARMMFSKLGVWDTEQNNGVLIYLLLAERAIELVADRGVTWVEPASAWQDAVARLGKALKANHFEDGLTQALEEVSAVLVRHFPQTDAPAEGRVNELPDEPVLR